MILRPLLLAGASLVAACAPAARKVTAPTDPAEVSVSSGQKTGARYLRDASRAAQGSGAGPLRLLAFGAATLGDRLEGMVHIPEGNCVLFLARASQQVEDLDLHLYGDDGTQYGVDESPDDLPTLLFCPEGAVRIYASARVAQGHGLVALGVQTVAPSEASDVAKAVGARNFSDAPQDLEEPWPGLGEALSDRRHDLEGKWVDKRRVALPVDARVPTHLSIEVPPQRCLDALFLPTPDVSELQLSVANANGQVIARGQARGRNRTLLLCAGERTHALTVAIRPYAGRGLAVAAISLSEDAPPQVRPDADVEMHYLDGTLASPELDRLPPASRKRTLSLARGKVHSESARTTGCTRIDLKPDARLLDYHVWIWSEDGSLLGETKGRGSRTLFVCYAGGVRIDAEALGRSGALALEFRRGGETVKGATQLPLAASRVMSEARDFGAMQLPQEIGRLTLVEVSDTRLTRVPLSVPAAHCQTLFLGGSHGTLGLEARIIHDKTGLEYDRAHGHHSLTVRACAPSGGHLNATLELRTTAGKTRAFLAQRQHKLKR